MRNRTPRRPSPIRRSLLITGSIVAVPLLIVTPKLLLSPDNIASVPTPDETPAQPDAPVLIAGPGFAGPTPEPNPVGNVGERGWDAKAIARWDVVPMQVIDDTFEVGVVAFHMNGIDRVEFSLDGGPWITASEASLNPRTGVAEYWATIAPSTLADGGIEIRAVVYPNVGAPRLLAGPMTADVEEDGEHSMFLHANAGGTLNQPVVYVSEDGNDATADGTEANPYATIWAAARAAGAGNGFNADHATIYLMEGTYELDGSAFPRPVTRDGWLNVEAAPGLSKDQVIVTPGKMRTKNVALRNVTYDGSGGGFQDKYSQLDPWLWLDDVDAVGPGPGENTKVTRKFGWDALYYTDTTIRSFKDGVEGATLARDTHVENIGSDAFSLSYMVLNSSVNDLHLPAGRDYHPDVFMLTADPTVSYDNLIVYGLLATDVAAQGMLADEFVKIENSAFVNILVENSGEGEKTQWAVPSEHVLFWRLTLRNQPFAWRFDKRFTGENISVRDSVFAKMEVDGEWDTSLDAGFKNNRFIDATSFGAIAPGAGVLTGPLSPEEQE